MAPTPPATNRILSKSAARFGNREDEPNGPSMLIGALALGRCVSTSNAVVVGPLSTRSIKVTSIAETSATVKGLKSKS